MKHSHYKRDISNLNLKVLDVYRLIELFNITCPVAQHVFKKSMAAGQRGHKDLRKDWQDMLDSAERRLQMLDEDAAAGIGDFGQQNMVEWPDDDSRVDAIGQNGNDGEHYRERHECTCSQFEIVGSCSICGKGY